VPPANRLHYSAQALQFRQRPFGFAVWRANLYNARVHLAYPILLNVKDVLVVIVGGGSVAVRKANGLLEAGATRVRVVSPDISPDMPAGVERVVARYEKSHLSGAKLVFAATNDSAVNEQVAADARQLGILVNRCDSNEEGSDFLTPAAWRHEHVTVAVSTSAGPSIAAKIRDLIRLELEPQWLALAAAMAEIRPRILASSSLPSDVKTATLRRCACDEVAHAAQLHGTQGVLSLIEEWTGVSL